MAEYGWRAYAVPVLAALTVAVLILPATTAHSAAAPAGLAGSGPVTVTQTMTAPPPTITVFATPTVTVAAKPEPGGSSDSSADISGPQGATVTAGALRAGGKAAAPVLTAAAISDATACSDNRTDSLILVSISQQHAWWCEKAHAMGSTPVTTGAVNTGDATPTGTWVVQAKQTDRYLVGPGYRDFVHYWMPFHGDFGLHDAPWQTFPFGSKQYTDDGSHGCVHFPEAAMARLYSWATVGTTVVTITA